MYNYKKIILEDIYDSIKQLYGINDTHRNRHLEMFKKRFFNLLEYHKEYINQEYVNKLKNIDFIIFNQKTYVFEVDINFKKLIKELK